MRRIEQRCRCMISGKYSIFIIYPMQITWNQIKPYQSNQIYLLKYITST